MVPGAERRGAERRGAERQGGAFRGAVVLNGGSSAGKTSIVRLLQDLLDEPWLAFGIDGLIESLPPRMRDAESSIEFRENGAIVIGDAFRELERAWMVGVAATVRAGANVLVDDVFLSGAASQARWMAALQGVPTRWVAVRCDAAVAEAREFERGWRVTGMARRQAAAVHVGVQYEFEVDTTRSDPATCARAIAEFLAGE